MVHIFVTKMLVSEILQSLTKIFAERAIFLQVPKLGVTHQKYLRKVSHISNLIGRSVVKNQKFNKNGNAHRMVVLTSKGELDYHIWSGKNTHNPDFDASYEIMDSFYHVTIHAILN